MMLAKNAAQDRHGRLSLGMGHVVNDYFDPWCGQGEFGELPSGTMKHLHFLTTKQLADQMGKPVSTIQRWARIGIIPSIQAGWRTRLYDPEAVRSALLRLTIPKM